MVLLLTTSDYLIYINLINKGNLQSQRKRVLLIHLHSRKIIRKLEVTPILESLVKASIDLLNFFKKVKMTSLLYSDMSYHYMKDKNISISFLLNTCRNHQQSKVCNILLQQFHHQLLQYRKFSIGTDFFILISLFLEKVKNG